MSHATSEIDEALSIPADVEELNRIKESLGTSVGCKKYFDLITQKFVPTVETERD